MLQPFLHKLEVSVTEAVSSSWLHSSKPSGSLGVDPHIISKMHLSKCCLTKPYMDRLRSVSFCSDF